MFWRIYRYEMRRAVFPYGIWTAVFLTLALIGRLDFLSLMDMPLFYLMFFSALGIVLYRYYSTMHGKEATYLFSLDLSAGKQMLIRYSSMIAWGIITACMIDIALEIQGMGIGGIIDNQPLFGRVLLVFSASFSFLTWAVPISAALSLSYVRPFSEHHTVWFFVFIIILFGSVGILSRTTEAILPAHMIISETGEVFVSETNRTRSSLSFSFNTCLWDSAYIFICMICMPAIIRKKLLITA